MTDTRVTIEGLIGCGTIYLRCDPQVALKRIKRRGRAGEENIDLSFLERLSEIHDKCLLNEPDVFVVDANWGSEKVRSDVTEFMKSTFVGG